MNLKRKTKRNSGQPKTKITNYGFDSTIRKIDEAIALISKK